MKTFITRQKWLKTTVVLIFWVMVWQIIYLLVNKEILVASPVSVLSRLVEISSASKFWITILYSVARILLGFGLSIFFGVSFAVASSYSRVVKAIFSPLLTAIKSTPVVSFIILVLIWVKSSYIPILISFMMVLPIFWENIQNGIENTDKKLLEMAKVYSITTVKKLKMIYIPSVRPYFLSSCNIGLGFAFKSGIAAEVIAGTGVSIGKRIYESKVHLNTVDLFLWTIVVILISTILEQGIGTITRQEVRR